MSHTMTPPVHWPDLQRLWRRLRANRADRQRRKTMQVDLDRLSDRMRRDIGLYERTHRPPHIVSRGH